MIPPSRGIRRASPCECAVSRVLQLRCGQGLPGDEPGPYGDEWLEMRSCLYVYISTVPVPFPCILILLKNGQRLSPLAIAVSGGRYRI